MRTFLHVTTGKKMDIQSAYQIRAALMARGYSLRTWALEKGYCARTVQKYVHLFAPKTKRIPKRKLARQIMQELAETLGVSFDYGDDL
jgi:lambda repressor-like predicted transcriptional regulator